MTFGVSALTCRLNADLPPPSAGSVDWADLLAWTSGMRPAFVGKYLIGSPWRWVHGEATTLIDPAVPGASLAVAPIQAADPVRQSETGELGEVWGIEDGAAIAAAIQAALDVGDLATGGEQPIYVYLEVDAGTALSPQYWSGWASAVSDAITVGSKPASGVMLPVLQALLPCIATPFTPDAAVAGHFRVPGPVRTALDQAATGTWRATRCHAFWAQTPDPAALVPTPTLDWSAFTTYQQPQRSGPAVEVPVRIWRYATGDPATPSRQVGKISLEATHASARQADPVLDAMLTCRPWGADEPAVRPTALGVDRGASLAREIRCLSTKKITVSHLPETTTGGTVGPPLAPPLSEPVTFAARYYSAGPTSTGQRPAANPKDLTRSEAARLSAAKVAIVSTWQYRVRYLSVPARLADPANGRKDGLAAGWFAAEVAHQPPHTPIYFAVDCDVTTSGVSSVAGGSGAITDAHLIIYFAGVAQGLQDYLTARDKKTRVPYAVGVYSCAHAFDVLYARGLASHYWQAFPPFWGDDVAGANSNLAPWRHANLWQVGMDNVLSVQVASGLLGCRARFAWIFTFNDQPGPPQIQVTVGPNVHQLSFPPTPGGMAAATGASVTVSTPEVGWTAYRIEFTIRPSNFEIATLGAVPAGFEAGVSEEQGLADLNVAWGDPGGWRAPRDAA